MSRFFPILLLSLCGLLEAQPESSAGTRTIDLTEGTNMAATVSPDGSTIVLELQGSLWSLPIQGGKARELTDPLLEPARPQFSPKGDAIAFQAYKGGNFHIWTMKPDGTELRKLTDGPGDDREPRYSPDGSRIAFSSDRAFKGSYDIWVVEIASGKLTQMTSSSADEYEPAWSPDGSEIAFVSGTGAIGKTIKVMSASGGPARTLMTAPVGNIFQSPAWAPDGKRIAYVLFTGTINVLMVSGQRVGTGDDVFPFYPEWLPGGRLLYTGNGRIHVTTVASGETRDIPFDAPCPVVRPPYRHKKYDLDSADRHQVKGIVGPSLSPDGKRILFQALNQIWVMEIGGKPEALTHDRYYKADPCWSPDGKSIAYSSDKGGTEDLYLLNLETRRERRLTATDDDAEVSAAWSPDGRKLAFHDQTDATFVLDIASGERKQVIASQYEPSKPCWVRNGKTVAIAAVKAFTRKFREGTSQILTADVATGETRFTPVAPYKSIQTRGEDGPVYSPDGTAVAYVMDSLLYISPVDGDGIPTGAGHSINDEATDAPTWSGDSRELLYLSNGRLRLISRDGSNLRTVPLDLSWANEDAAPGRTIIHAGRLWDGRGPEVKTDVDIVVSGHRIESVEPHRAPGPDDGRTRYVDATNLTVTPGLWETHTHHWMAGKFYGDRIGRLWLTYGVTTLESQSDPAYRAVEARESFASGARVGPRFFATGEAMDGSRIYYALMRPITSEAQLRRELSRAEGLEYDHIKTYVRLPHAMQKEVVDFAHNRLGVVVDSHYLSPGVRYGLDGTTHISATCRLGYAYGRSNLGISYGDVLSLYEQSGAYAISQLREAFILYSEQPNLVDDRRLTVLNTPWEEASLRAKRGMALSVRPTTASGGQAPAFILDTLRREETTVAAILKGGGTVLAGTDSPLHEIGIELHLNFRTQVEFGQEPWRALQTGTLLAARAYGVEADLGSVEPGKLADLDFIEGNPLEDINDMVRVRFVMKGGRLFTLPELMAPFEKSGG